jgi:hypothetical protein
MTTSVKGSLLMKVKNNEENLFTSVLQDIEAQVTTMVIRAQSLSPLHRLHWFPSLPSCPGRSYISRKQFERDLVTDHELASRLVSPRTKSECGQEWLPALDTIYLHHVEYVPVMFNTQRMICASALLGKGLNNRKTMEVPKWAFLSLLQ